MLESHVDTVRYRDVDPTALQKSISELSSAIDERGDLPYATVNDQKRVLAELQDFELGRWLIVNRGLNGFWTHEIIVNQENGKSEGQCANQTEFTLFNGAPAVLATRERARIFQRIIRANLKDGISLLSVPSGLMWDLLSLPHNEYKDLKLYGIDKDPTSIQLAYQLAAQLELDLSKIKISESDAWSFSDVPKVNIIVSNGLNIYVQDRERVVALYQEFARHLQPEDLLVTSFLTPPPLIDPNGSTWDMSAIDATAAATAKLIFSDILQVTWQSFRTVDEMKSILDEAGFEKFEIIFDRAKIFPTITARRKQ